ncbi:MULTISPECIES: hypothetical protein [Thermus]|uniref:Uncharacterized protein n=1 Tax=Thermus scotoductus TaxID=37636 RepID=A0A430V004_THESC|nr:MULTISPECIES: hypothetical protein [Thermus]RTI15304.1 hypothetical protein CSW27_06055 [Thermus scotoductus]BDG27159.1 hypothetical protein TthSNM66_17950 [Thermus thermophilus]
MEQYPASETLLPALEEATLSIGRDFLYRVHLSLHQALGLPPLPRGAVERAYSMPIPHRTLAKARVTPEEAWSRAVQRFRDLKARGLPMRPRDIRALSSAAVDRWYALGMVEDRAKAQALRNFLAGFLRANPRLPDTVPQTVPEAAALLRLRDVEVWALEWAVEHMAENMRGLAEDARRGAAQILMGAVGRSDPPEGVARQLLDRFGSLNRDWRRITITETAAAHGAGFLTAMVGQEVEWVAAQDACPYCRRYHGKRFLVVAPDHPNKDFQVHLWPGKTNVGRSFHPYTATGKRRTKDELAGPAIPAHPHCRCRVVPAVGRSAYEDPETMRRIRALLEL